MEGAMLVVGETRYNLCSSRLFLIAAGKAALSMGRAALEIVNEQVWGGVIITKQTDDGSPRTYFANAGRRRQNIAVFEAGHPIPTESSLRATRAAMDLLEETKQGDVLLFLLSGGASALLTSPRLPLGEWRQLNQVLLESGCTINELNCVRKQLDRVKGGHLAEMAAPAATIGLILSDVVGNPLDVIGSGPTVPNEESPGDALTILHRYDIMKKVTPETWAVIGEALTDPRHATSLARVKDLSVQNVIIGDVRIAASAAVDAARQSGFQAELLTAHLEGEAREVGKFAGALAKDLGAGCAWILGGETTVTVRGQGVGGRNQEIALAACLAIEGASDRVIAAFATDGEDGPTAAAGAVVTGETAVEARMQGLDPAPYLQDNDSHTFFHDLAIKGRNYLLSPGPTGTNVNDLLFILHPEHAGDDSPDGSVEPTNS